MVQIGPFALLSDTHVTIHAEHICVVGKRRNMSWITSNRATSDAAPSYGAREQGSCGLYEASGRRRSGNRSVCTRQVPSPSGSSEFARVVTQTPDLLIASLLYLATPRPYASPTDVKYQHQSPRPTLVEIRESTVPNLLLGIILQLYSAMLYSPLYSPRLAHPIPMTPVCRLL